MLYTKEKGTYIHGVTGYLKRLKEMAELKWMFTLLQVGGLTAYVWALFISFVNVDIITRTVLSSIGALFVIVKLIDFIATRIRKHKLENLEIRSKELVIREREIETYEKETAIIRGYENGK